MQGVGELRWMFRLVWQRAGAVVGMVFDVGVNLASCRGCVFCRLGCLAYWSGAVTMGGLEGCRDVERGGKRWWVASFKSINDGMCESVLKDAILEKSCDGIDLSCNSIGPEGARVIAQVLEHHETITEVDISANAIGDHGAAYFSELIQNSSNIKFLDLHANQITDQGASAIAAVLLGNESLEDLDLSANYITDEGASHLAQAIKKNKTLKSISLRSNDFTSIGQQVLLEAVEQNDRITTIEGTDRMKAFETICIIT